MKRLKLKQHSLSQKKLNKEQIVDPYYYVIEQMEGEKHEQDALTLLLSTYEQNKNLPPKNQWVILGDYLPPYTNETIVISDPTYGDNLHISYVFLQHYLLDKYLYKFRNHSSLKNIKWFMLLSDPNV